MHNLCFLTDSHHVFWDKFAYKETTVGWMVVPKTMCPHSNSQKLWVCPCLRKRVFADVRILSQDHPGLSRWALKLRTFILWETQRGDLTGEALWPQGRDWSDAATSQETLETPEAGRVKESSLS